MKNGQARTEFDDFYERELELNLLDLEKKRIDLRKILLKGIAIAAQALPVIFLVFALVPAVLDGNVIKLEFWRTMPAGILFYYLIGLFLFLGTEVTLFKTSSIEEKKSLYQNSFSQWQNGPLIKFLDPSFSCNPNSSLTESEFKESGLYGSYEVEYGPIRKTPMSSNIEFHAGSEITGDFHGAKIRCADCSLSVDRGRDAHRRTEFLFDGMLLTVELEGGRTQHEHTILAPANDKKPGYLEKNLYKGHMGKIFLVCGLCILGMPLTILILNMSKLVLRWTNSIPYLPDYTLGYLGSFFLCIFIYVLYVIKILPMLAGKTRAPYTDIDKIQDLQSANGKELTNITNNFPVLQGRFEVLSDDLQAAQKTLDQKTLAHLIEFHDKINRNIRVAFVYDKIQMAIWHNEKIRPPRIWSSILNRDYIKGYLQEYLSALKIVSSALSR